MKHYPSISREQRYGPCYVFPKYDGSNIRVEWTPKRGFDKWGSRKVLIGPDSLLSEAISLIREREGVLVPIFEKQRWEKVTCFFEFWGPNSFAGLHEPQDKKVVTLLDLDIYKRGQIDPRDFQDLFNHPDIGAALPIGERWNHEYQKQVTLGVYDGQTAEGIVGKVPSHKRWQPPYMFKWKTLAWIERVKAKYGPKAEEFL